MLSSPLTRSFSADMGVHDVCLQGVLIVTAAAAGADESGKGETHEREERC